LYKDTGINVIKLKIIKNPGEDEIFCPSRPALGPTQPPVK